MIQFKKYLFLVLLFFLMSGAGCASATNTITKSSKSLDSIDIVKPHQRKMDMTSLGCVEGNCEDGIGTFIYSNKENYVGAFKNGKRNGEGKLIYINGDHFVGIFENDKKTGQGKYSWVNGDHYLGEFNNGKISGKGVYTFQSGGVYDGTFHEDGSGRGLFFVNDKKQMNCEIENRKILCGSGDSPKKESPRQIQKPVERIRFEGNR